MSRAVAQILMPTEDRVGQYLVIQRAFPNRTFAGLDPFLLIDHAGPLTIPPGSPPAGNPHPHRGFETITYILQGELAHADSFGHRGSLGAGGVQRMTAGSGIMHDESPSLSLLASGGSLELVQIWVNLPRKDKMMQPDYQDVPPSAVPQVGQAGARIRVLCGDALGVTGPVKICHKLLCLHVMLEAGGGFRHTLPDDTNVAAFVLRGTIFSSERIASQDQCMIFETRGDEVALSALADPAEALLLAGTPLREPIARWGPFVMNTREEITQAVEEFRAGKFGVIT